MTCGDDSGEHLRHRMTCSEVAYPNIIRTFRTLWNYLDVLPAGITVKPVVDVVVEAFCQTIHEGSSGSDTVCIEMLLRSLLGRQMESLRVEFSTESLYGLSLLCGFLRCSEPAIRRIHDSEDGSQQEILKVWV